MIELGIPLEALAFLLGIVAAFAILAFLPILNLVLSIAEYSYANTRISGMSGALIKKKQYNELIDASNLEEFVAMLESSAYAEQFGKVGNKINEHNVEDAIEKCHAAEKEKIIKMLPESAKKVLGIYFKREEVKLIKNVMRQIASGYKKFESLEAVGDITSERLNSLFDAEGVKEFVAHMEGTEYYEPLNNALVEYEASGNLLSLESALDRYILEKIGDGVAFYQNMPLMKEFVGREIDVANIMITLRVKVDEIKGNELEKYLIKGGYELGEKKTKDIVDSESVHDVVSRLEDTGYGEILSGAMAKFNEGELSVFEDALRNYRFRIATDFATQALQIGPVLGYFVKKDNEVTNLKTIMKCESISMDKDKIEGLLVI